MIFKICIFRTKELSLLTLPLCLRGLRSQVCKIFSIHYHRLEDMAGLTLTKSRFDFLLVIVYKKYI